MTRKITTDVDIQRLQVIAQRCDTLPISVRGRLLRLLLGNEQFTSMGPSIARLMKWYEEHLTEITPYEAVQIMRAATRTGAVLTPTLYEHCNKVQESVVQLDLSALVHKIHDGGADETTMNALDAYTEYLAWAATSPAMLLKSTRPIGILLCAIGTARIEHPRLVKSIVDIYGSKAVLEVHPRSVHAAIAALQRHGFQSSLLYSRILSEMKAILGQPCAGIGIIAMFCYTMRLACTLCYHRDVTRGAEFVNYCFTNLYEPNVAIFEREALQEYYVADMCSACLQTSQKRCFDIAVNVLTLPINMAEVREKYNERTLLQVSKVLSFSTITHPRKKEGILAVFHRYDSLTAQPDAVQRCVGILTLLVSLSSREAVAGRIARALDVLQTTELDFTVMVGEAFLFLSKFHEYVKPDLWAHLVAQCVRNKEKLNQTMLTALLSGIMASVHKIPKNVLDSDVRLLFRYLAFIVDIDEVQEQSATRMIRLLAVADPLIAPDLDSFITSLRARERLHRPKTMVQAAHVLGAYARLAVSGYGQRTKGFLKEDMAVIKQTFQLLWKNREDLRSRRDCFFMVRDALDLLGDHWCPELAKFVRTSLK